MNIKEEIINTIKYFQRYIGEILSNYQINNAICDFYDFNKNKFREYGNCLGHISSALNYRQYMLCYLLFYHDKESKSIPKLINQIKDNRVVADKELDKQLKNIALKINSELNSFSLDIENLKEYRYDIYAHWNTKVFNESWQEQFIKDHPINYSNLLLLCQKCFEHFSNILVIIGDEPFDKSLTKDFEINHFIDKLKK